MRDIYTEASPYEVEGDKIVYYRGFKDRSKLRPHVNNEEVLNKHMELVSINSKDE